MYGVWIYVHAKRGKTSRWELIVFVHRLVNLDANSSELWSEKVFFFWSWSIQDYCYKRKTRPKFNLWVKVIECTHIRVHPIDTNYRRLIISFDKSVGGVVVELRLSIARRTQPAAEQKEWYYSLLEKRKKKIDENGMNETLNRWKCSSIINGRWRWWRRHSQTDCFFLSNRENFLFHSAGDFALVS